MYDEVETMEWLNENDFIMPEEMFYDADIAQLIQNEIADDFGIEDQHNERKS